MKTLSTFKFIRSIVFLTLSLFLSSSAFAFDTVRVKLQNLWLADVGNVHKADWPSSVELTRVDQKVKIWQKTEDDGYYKSKFYIYGTLLKDGKAKVEARQRCYVLGVATSDQSVIQTLYSSKGPISFHACYDHGATRVKGELKVSAGTYEIVCSPSIISGYTISENPGMTRTYFSSPAYLKSSTVSTCTYVGDVTTTYSVPGASGSNTVRDQSRTFPLEQVEILQKK